MQFRPSGQPNMNMNRVTGDYEIKTFTGNQRSRSPIEAYSQNYRRSPIRAYEQGTSESAQGEMIYLDPNDTNFRRGQNMSPLNDSRNIIMRSPVTQNIRNEYGSGGIINMSQHMNYSHIPRVQQATVEIERKERFSRSPKTINIGESPQEVEYNMRTLNRGRMPNMSPPGNIVADRSYNMMSNETGNIFLDQPLQQGGVNYMQQNDAFNSSTGMIQQGMNDQRGLEQNSREIQFSMNPRDLQEPLPGVLRKMSPKGNVEGDSDTNSEKNDNVNQIKDLKSQLDRNNHVMFKNEDGMNMGEINRNRGDMENIEVMARTREFQENVTGEEVKKLIKYYVKTYDPHKGEDGNLISNSQMIIQSNQDQLFNDRYKVLQKMNKLSSILLAKNRGGSHDSASLNRSIGEDGKSKFDRSTLNNTNIKDGTKKTLRNTRHNRFLYVSLAMLSAKGPNTEDRTILRRMRLDKGGVVDLAQESIQKKSKFKIKKARAGGRGFTAINPKYREKAAKILQAWWRERKIRYKKILEQIIKIQSVWRGKFTRKYVYDIIYISYLQEKFLAIMRNVLVNHVRPYVFNELFSKNKLIKDILGELLTKYDRRFTLLRLRPYFLKWKNSSDFLSQRIMKSKDLFNKKVDNENKLTLLKKYFDKWVLLSNLYKYIGKAQNAEEKRNKFFGTLNMINGLSSLTKRHVFKNTREPISNYLKDLLKQKILIKIIKNIRKKCTELILRNNLNKWRVAVHKKKLEDVKREAFLNSLNHVDNRINKNKMKYYLDKWRRQIPKGKKILDINDGVEIFRKFVKKVIYREPLEAYMDKCNQVNKREGNLKMIIIKRRYLKDNLRDFFNRWKNNKIRLDDKDKRNELYNTLLKNIISKIEKRILYKRFNQWRTRPKVDVKGEMKKYVDFTKIMQKIVKNYYNDEYDTFLKKFEKTRDVHSLNKAGQNVFNFYYNKKSKMILKYYLYKWRSKIKDYELKDLHKQLLKFLVTSLDAKNDRNALSKYFTRWRLFVGDGKNYDNLEKLKLVMKGGDLLGNLYKRRLRDLFYRLYRKMGKDYRPIILKKIFIQINKPRTTLRECFDRWRRAVEKKKVDTNISKVKAKIININIKNVKSRNDRDKLMRAFFHWRAMSKKPEEYYPRINHLIQTLSKNIKKSAVDEPFDIIRETRNPERYLLKLFKNYKNQEKRLLYGKLINLFGRWRKTVGDIYNKDIRTKIIYKLKTFLDEGNKKKLLAKYLTLWKANSRKKGLDVNFTKGIDKLIEIFKKPVRKVIYNIYKQKIIKVSKNKGANDIFRVVDKTTNNKLHTAFLRWWRNAMKIDPNKNTKVKTKLRRIIKYNEIEPIAKAFHKWARNVQLLKLKEKDLYHATKTIAGALRNNDKMNLNHAMSRWKKKIQLLREKYLKELLCKQIKATIIMKDQMNNEARLRAALLKWRANLIPIDYINRIKQIRKGCKLFKLALKKLHERDILDNVKDLAKENKKKYILNKVIIKLIPDLAKYQMKRVIDVWKSKLGDTNRMKNKIKQLFEDYVYSDHVHDGLFKKPKDDIIELSKVCDEMKRDAAQKISNFLKNVQKIPEHIRKLKLTLLLSGILKNKDKQLDDIKKMQFIRFYRQTQKVKNHENAKIIQKFIKEKLRKYLDKKKYIKNGLDLLNLFIKRKCLNKINDCSNNNYIVTIIKKVVHKKEENYDELLREKLKQWRDKVGEMQTMEKIIKIQKIFRAHKAKELLNNIKTRNILTYKLYTNYDTVQKNILLKYIHEWLRRALMTKNNENASIIQNFCRRKMLLLQQKKAKDKLRILFKKYPKYKLALIMEKASRIIGGKGEVLYKTLQDILYRNPFDKFINNLKFAGKVNSLKETQPRIHDAVSRYYLTKTLRKWKENTYDQTIKHTIMLQKFLRDQYEKKMRRDKERREYLMLEIINKLIKNNKYKLQLPFNIWKKKVKLEKMNENATKIQNKFREYLAKEKAKNLSTISKYLRLVRNIKTKNLLDILKKVSERKILTEKQTEILTVILSRKIVFTDKAGLENCFNKWRKINQMAKDNATKIANAFRTYKARKEKDRLLRINILIEKYFLKHDKANDDIKRSKLRKWYNKAKLLQYNENSRTIQRFIKPKLYRILNERFKNYFKDHAKKKVYKLILYAAKINKLQHALNRPSLQRFRNNLEKITENNIKNEILGRTLTDINEKIIYVLIKKYLHRWTDNNQKITEKTNDSASVIQRFFKLYKARKEKDRLLTIKKLLITYLLKKEKNTNNKLYSTFMKWLNIVRNLQCNDNATVIQKFCREVLDKLRRQKELARQLKIKNGLEKLFNIKFGSRYVMDKINSEKNRNIFSNFNYMLKYKRKDILKDCFDNIKQRAFDNVLRKVIKIPDLLRTRIIKKFITIMKDKTDKLGKKRSVETIIKNWKIYLNNKKQKNKEEILTKILYKLVVKKSNILKNYFDKWIDAKNKLKERAAKVAVARFISERFRLGNARKNWIDLVNKLKLRNRNSNLFEVVKTIKKYIFLNRLKNPIKKFARKSFIEKVKENKQKTVIYEVLVKLLPKTNEKRNNTLIRDFFDKWRNNSYQLREREKRLEYALDNITKRQTINDLDTTRRIMILKKLFHDVPRIRAREFLEKVRQNAINKYKYEKLVDDTLRAKDDLDIQNKIRLMNKVYKLYIYNKLKNMFKACNEFDDRLKKIYGLELFYKLLMIKTNNSAFNYNNNLESTNQPKTTKLSFKNKIQKKEVVISDRNAPMRKILPSLVNYIQKIINKRNRDSFDNIKSKLINNKFCQLFKAFSTRTIKPEKEDFVRNIRREAKYSETRPQYQVKLFKLLRKKYIRTITTTLIEPSRLYRLFYLINMTKMHKNIAEQRFYRELIRKWRFISFTKKMARKKLELMYKNLHASYLQMADEIFGDDNNVNPSVFKEFERFGTNVGMFTGQEPEVDEELNKRYYQTVDKKYVFTTKASATLPSYKKVLKTETEQYEEEELIEGEEPKGAIRHFSTDYNKDFRKLQKGGGLSGKKLFQ